MNREAINYVKEAEARVEQLRARAEEDIKEIELRNAEEIQAKKVESAKEIEAYRLEKEAKVKQILESDQLAFQEEVSNESKQYEHAYEDKKGTLANRIAEEVLHRYGNS